MGMHYWLLAQLWVFCMDSVITTESKLFCLWNSVGFLTGLLWFPIVSDRANYLDGLETAVANVLDGFAELVP